MKLCEDCGSEFENEHRDVCDSCFNEYLKEQKEYERQLNDEYYSSRF